MNTFQDKQCRVCKAHVDVSISIQSLMLNHSTKNSIVELFESLFLICFVICCLFSVTFPP